MVIAPGWWKRWPTVAAPDFRPAISNATISSPSKAPMPWRGRNQRSDSVDSEASPQRIDLGQGKARTMAGIASASTAAVARQGLSIVANSTPSRSTSCSRSSPVLRRKPSSACGGALERGPFSSSLTASVCAGRPRAIRARRRGVTWVSTDSAARPAASSCSRNSRARSADALACMRAGISSERSSSRKSLMTASLRPSVFFHPGLARAFAEVADAADIGLTLGHRDDAAGVQQVEHVARLDRLLVGGDRQAGGEAILGFGGGLAEQVEQGVGVRHLEIPGRHLLLVLEEDVAIGDSGPV